MTFLEKLMRWLGRRREVVREVAAGGITVSSPDEGIERSTNAQVAGAAEEPYPGND